MKKIVFIALVLILTLFVFSSSVFAFPPSGDNLYSGIDVSKWQGDIDFAKVKASGVKVVYIRSSSGNDYIDPYFRQNYENAKAQDLKIGFYHALTAKTTKQAEQEARNFVKTISGTNPDCRLAMDLVSTTGLSNDEINNIARTFLESVKEFSGKDVMIYSSAYAAKAIWDRSLNIYPLWVANYGVNEPEDNGKWSTWAGFQYSNTGRINGISGDVDLDWFTDEVFLDDTSDVPEPDNPHPSDPDDNIIYITVKRGDTLSEIARQYGTTVDEIVELNDISNPDLIYVGQQLEISTSQAVPSEDVKYTVVRGDTLSKIARQFGTTVSSLVELNNIINPDLIYPGQILIIKKGQSSSPVYYTVKKGDTLSEIAEMYHTTVSKLSGINNIRNINLIYVGQVIEIA